MLSEVDLFEFAQKVATFYCRKHNKWDDYDDAVQEVCVHLLENRSHLEKSEKILYRQEFLRLVRWYQNANGLRRKHKIDRSDYPVSDLSTDGSVSNEKEEAYALLEIAMTNGSFCAKEREILWSLIYKASRVDIVKTDGLSKKTYGLSKREILRLKKKLEVELSRLSDVPVKGEIESCPLLYYAGE